MEKTQYSALIECMRNHHLLKEYNPDKYLELLTKYDLNDTDYFSIPLPFEDQSYIENSVEKSFTLSRLLVNKRINEQYPFFEEFCLGIKDFFGFHSDDHLVQDLRDNKELGVIIFNSGTDYSLLGKLNTSEKIGKSNYTITRPVLIVPGNPNSVHISLWEKVNAKVPKEYSEQFGLPYHP